MSLSHSLLKIANLIESPLRSDGLPPEHWHASSRQRQSFLGEMLPASIRDAGEERSRSRRLQLHPRRCTGCAILAIFTVFRTPRHWRRPHAITAENVSLLVAPRRGALIIGRRFSFSAGIPIQGSIPVPEGRGSALRAEQ